MAEDHRTLSRQSKSTPKCQSSIKWETNNYDYLIKRSEAEGMSIAAIANQIIRQARQTVPRGEFEIP